MQKETPPSNTDILAAVNMIAEKVAHSEKLNTDEHNRNSKAIEKYAEITMQNQGDIKVMKNDTAWLKKIAVAMQNDMKDLRQKDWWIIGLILTACIGFIVSVMAGWVG